MIPRNPIGSIREGTNCDLADCGLAQSEPPLMRILHFINDGAWT